MSGFRKCGVYPFNPEAVLANAIPNGSTKCGGGDSRDTGEESEVSDYGDGADDGFSGTGTDTGEKKVGVEKETEVTVRTIKMGLQWSG